MVQMKGIVMAEHFMQPVISRFQCLAFRTLHSGRQFLGNADHLIVRGDELVSAQPDFDHRTNEPIISFRFNNAGARKFGNYTRDHVGRRFAIVLDDKVVSAPVIRESGGDRSAVTGGTTVLSDRIVVRITTKPGESFIDRMIALVEGAERQKTPNEVALTILLTTLTIIFLVTVMALQPLAVYSGEAHA